MRASVAQGLRQPPRLDRRRSEFEPDRKKATFGVQRTQHVEALRKIAMMQIGSAGQRLLQGSGHATGGLRTGLRDEPGEQYDAEGEQRHPREQGPGRIPKSVVFILGPATGDRVKRRVPA